MSLRMGLSGLQSLQMSGSHPDNATMKRGSSTLPQSGSVLGCLSFGDESSISIGNKLSRMSPPVQKEPKIQLLLFEDTWADDNNHDAARDNQGHRNERYQEDAASAGGKFASDDPVLMS